MPSKSPAQKYMMAAAAHDPAFAKKVGVPTKVAKEFNTADMAKGMGGAKGGPMGGGAKSGGKGPMGGAGKGMVAAPKGKK